MLELLTTRDPIEMARYGKDLVGEFFVSEGVRNGVNEMIDKNAAAQAMLEICMVRMPNQSLSDADARNVYEFMRKNDGVK